MYFFNKRIVTAIVDFTSPILIGSMSIPIAPGGMGSISIGDYIMYGNKVYKTDLLAPLDLAVGGTVPITEPIEELLESVRIDILTVMDLTGAEFNSQIRTTANSPDIIATITATLASPPTLGYFDLYISDEDTGAIPTPEKTDYTKKAKFTCDGELVIGGDVKRSYNGTVQVSPQVTRLIGEP
jgi:hypothetical protein